MTADDRQGVQCTICHRLVDPVAAPGAPRRTRPSSPRSTQPVPTFGDAMMVVDPLDRRRGPFDIVADLGIDPHAPDAATLVSPFHRSAELCGTCHNVRNPLFTKNDDDRRVRAQRARRARRSDARASPSSRPSTSGRRASTPTTGVYAPQFGGNQRRSSRPARTATCRTSPAATRARGLTRDDLPLHELVGANTFMPARPAAPPGVRRRGRRRAPRRRASSAPSTCCGARRRVERRARGRRRSPCACTNETGHKLPTGYPDGRRMWLHVRAFDAKRRVVFESGRYVFADAALTGYGAEPGDPDYDPNLHVWETRAGHRRDGRRRRSASRPDELPPRAEQRRREGQPHPAARLHERRVRGVRRRAGRRDLRRRPVLGRGRLPGRRAAATAPR